MLPFFSKSESRNSLGSNATQQGQGHFFLSIPRFRVTFPLVFFFRKKVGARKEELKRGQSIWMSISNVFAHSLNATAPRRIYFTESYFSF